MKSRFIFSILIFIIGLHAQASLRFDMDTEVGRGYLSSNVGLSQFFPTEEGKVYFSQWNVSVGGNQSQYEDSTTGETTVTRGRQGSVGAGIGFDRKWSIDLSLFGNNTPETNFGESGSNLQLSYVLKKIQGSDFGFGVGVGGGSSKIGQKISFKIGNFTVNRDVELSKTDRSFYVNLYAFSWLTLKADYQIYNYSRSKSDLQAAYASRFLNYYTSDLINSIGGLPEYAGSFSALAAVSDDWDLSILARKTHLIVDDSDSKKYQIYADRYFETWTGGFGLSRSETTQGLESSLLARWGVDF